MAHFFLNRPVFAIVISLFLILAGSLTMLRLPVAEYPEISPPTVKVNTTYPGANSIVVTKSTITPMDSQINGVTDMRYVKSIAADDGTAQITVTFLLERDVDIAAVETQNRVSQVMPRLPDEVKDIGVTVAKSSPDVLMFVTLYSPTDSFDQLFLDNYLYNYWVDPIKRVQGVGDLTVFGSEFGMRIWLRPHRMAQLGLSVNDIVAAIKEQNKQAAAGKVGQRPAKTDSGFEYSLSVQGRLVTVEQFENIILRAEDDGSLLRVKDVARVELGAKTYDTSGKYNGHSSATFGVYLSPGANSMATAAGVHKKMEELAKSFPGGLTYEVVYDTSRFVKQSIEEVLHTFFEALLLVLIVVFLFLQSWRATIIPMLAVPVSLIATFIIYQVLGFSINTLSLFGMILAIGIVVDDAIVVVEAVEHKITHLGMSAMEGTREAMSEVSGPVVAIALVLSSVFVPMAFVPGVTGQLYKQFALTIAISTMFSAFVALTLTPVLCASMLRPKTDDDGPLQRFFTKFNNGFDRMNKRYVNLTEKGVRNLKRVMLFFSLFVIALYFVFTVTPTGFVPDEDKGGYFVQVLLPEASKTARTTAVVDKLSEEFQKLPGVKGVVGVTGYDLISSVNAPSAGLLIVELEDWAKRTKPDQQVKALIEKSNQIGFETKEAIAFAFNTPPLPGYGNVSGFSMMLQAQNGQTPTDLADVTQQFIAEAKKRPEIGRVDTTFAANTPNYDLEVDREKVKTLNIPINDLFTTLQVFLGSLQVNDFTLFGKNYRVSVQAEAEYRRNIHVLSQLFVRNLDGEMVPLDTVITAKPSTAPRFVMRYNLFPTAELTGSAAPGYSSGEALQALRETAAKVLPEGYGYQWSGQTLEEVETGDAAFFVLLLSVVCAFLFLAALYESWAVPISVLLVIPFGIMGALAGIHLASLDFNVYGQIGLVTLIGLSAKNAILIVEYAELNRKQGKPLIEAALEAAKLRLRPILMTSFAFILGVVPLMIATGAGSASKESVGTVVFSGMLAATMMGVFFVPAFYVLIRGLADRVSGGSKDDKESEGGADKDSNEANDSKQEEQPA